MILSHKDRTSDIITRLNWSQRVREYGSSVVNVASHVSTLYSYHSTHHFFISYNTSYILVVFAIL